MPIDIDSLCDWTHLATIAHATPQDRIAAFRTTLKAANQALREAFDNGADAASVVHARARLVDRLMIMAWNQLAGPMVSAEQAALVAVGGYGRGELHPASDVDVLILLTKPCSDSDYTDIGVFLTFLWDIGLEIGHSVRTIAECVEHALQDITVATNLMEARLLAGPAAAFAQMQRETGPEQIWPSRAFFQAKRSEQIARHARFHDTAYNLEPNVKESPGGLRDLQVIAWVAKRHFGANTLEDLVAPGFLTQTEYQTLSEHQHFLWRVRIGLHFLTGRREDRLLFDHQRRLALMFGFSDSDHRLAVEQFMKQYYRTVIELTRLNEMLLQYFDEEILGDGELQHVVAINRRFQARNGFIEARRPDVFRRYPFALLEIFLLLAQHPELRGVRANTIRLIRDHRYLIDDTFRNDLRCRSLFMELFRQPHGLTHELRRMNRYGVLAEYLPVFGHIVGQMQHDLFHVYTVDEHTMFVVRNMRRLTVTEFAHELPQLSQIIRHIPKPELLYLAGLFHDIAKGRGGDHSELGAQDAVDFCRHHGLSSYDGNLVAWLVKHHLVMSTTAQRKDISDPDVIQEFAAKVGTQLRLDYLYLLTVSDIRATSPTLWNSWKAALLRDLFEATRRALRRGLENPLDQRELAAETREQALERLQPDNTELTNIDRLWSTLDDDYFARHSVDEVVMQTRAILSAKTPESPLASLRRETHRGGSELFVYASDSRRLFATITSTLERLGLTITDARICTSRDQHALDTFIVLEKNGEPIESLHRCEEIQHAVHDALRHIDSINIDKLPTLASLPRRLKHFPISTEIGFRQDTGNQRSIIEIVTGDRPGLLALIAKAMLHCGIRLQNAKISTLGERAEDVFFVTDELSQPVREDGQLKCLRETLVGILDSKAA